MSDPLNLDADLLLIAINRLDPKPILQGAVLLLPASNRDDLTNRDPKTSNDL
jgi:hypothetical protein